MCKNEIISAILGQPKHFYLVISRKKPTFHKKNQIPYWKFFRFYGNPRALNWKHKLQRSDKSRRFARTHMFLPKHSHGHKMHCHGYTRLMCFQLLTSKPIRNGYIKSREKRRPKMRSFRREVGAKKYKLLLT